MHLNVHPLQNTRWPKGFSPHQSIKAKLWAFTVFLSITLKDFDVEYIRFTLASCVNSHNTWFSNKLNYITKRPKTRLSLICFGYLGPKFCLVSRNFQKLKENCNAIINLLLNHHNE